MKHVSQAVIIYIKVKADRAVGREDYGRPQCPTPGNWCFGRFPRQSFFPWNLFQPKIRRDSNAPVKQVRSLNIFSIEIS